VEDKEKLVSKFDELDKYVCLNCGHVQNIHLCGWAAEQLRCPKCYEMMNLVEESDD